MVFYLVFTLSLSLFLVAGAERVEITVLCAHWFRFSRSNAVGDLNKTISSHLGKDLKTVQPLEQPFLIFQGQAFIDKFIVFLEMFFVLLICSVVNEK